MKASLTRTSRRKLLQLFASIVGFQYFAKSALTKDGVADTFDSDLVRLSKNGAYIDQFRRDRGDLIAAAGGLERAPSHAAPSMTRISERATALIVACEVGSQARYTNRYTHPTWPKGESGITIGIGYDIGYATPDDFEREWSAYLPVVDVTTLRRGCGIFGQSASDLVVSFPAIGIEWAIAMEQFTSQTLPRYVGTTERALPNCSSLSPDSLGALVSLVYNRGASFSIPAERDPDCRFTEMREIKSLMSQSRFEGIPEQIRKMKRIWQGNPDMKGLLARRDVEASLFAFGLSGTKSV